MVVPPREWNVLNALKDPFAENCRGGGGGGVNSENFPEISHFAYSGRQIPGDKFPGGKYPPSSLDYPTLHVSLGYFIFKISLDY